MNMMNNLNNLGFNNMYTMTYNYDPNSGVLFFLVIL